MNLSKVFEEVSKELNIDKEVIREAYLSQWKFIREHIEELPLKGITEEEFSKLRVSFNIPSIGKFYTTMTRVDNLRKRFEYLKELLNDKDQKH